MEFEESVSAYKSISILGECFGGKAVVHLAKHMASGKMTCLKKFYMDEIKENSHLVQREIILTRQLKHPNILPYYTTFVHNLEICVVTPLMAFGSCRTLLNTHFNDGFPELLIIHILKDLLDAIQYLHKNGFIHRAIRASHILISETGKASLTGFRYACHIINNGRWQKNVHSFPSSTRSNLNWLSPEILEQNLQGYNEKSDIYSIGMVCCELANGKEPFADVTIPLMFIEKVRGAVPELLDCNTINSLHADRDCQGDYDISSNVQKRIFSNDLHEFNYLCLQREPYARPTANQLLSHPLFKQLKKGVFLPELLKPAIPLSDRVAYNTDDMASYNNMHHLLDLEVQTCEWEF